MGATRVKKARRQPEVKPVEVPADTEAALSIRVIAALLQCNRRTLERQIASKDFPAHDFKLLGKYKRWHKDTFNEWYRSNFRKTEV